MKPNDKALDEALSVTQIPEENMREYMRRVLTAAFAAQFPPSDDYAGLVKELREDVLQFNLKDTAYENIAKDAADALEAVLAERDALKAELAAANKRAANRLAVEAERDALLARLAPVDDKALVEIASKALHEKHGGPDDETYHAIVRCTLAAIRPHIEAVDEITRLRAENEKLREALKPLAAITLWTDKYPDGPLSVGDNQRYIDPQWIVRARAALEGVTEPASPWREIESAPKDKEILVFGKIDDGTDYQEVCKYYDAANCWPIVLMHGYLAPTHWMPLPEPPR